MSLVTYANFSINHNSSALPNAHTKLDFLFSTENIDSLINNSTFTQTLGCSDSSQTVSCSDACGNVTAAFLNWPNFYSCSWYPILAESLSDSNLNDTQVEQLDNKGFSSNESNFPSNVSKTIANCLSDYCLSSADCLGIDTSQSCSLDNLLSSNGSSSELNRTSAIVCLRDGVCGSTATVNPDIGGLGVVLSLMIQYSLSIGAFILHFLFDLKYRITKWRWKRKGNPEASNKPLAKAKKIRTEHLEALTSAVVEFQKSQCFFAATLQIASLIVVPTFDLGAHTRDQILLRLTAANAFAPIVLTLAHIELLGGRSSVYILLLSMLTYALGTAAYFESSPTYEGSLLYFHYENPVIPVLSCGNFAPFAPCYYGNELFVQGFWQENKGISYYGQTQNTGKTVWIITSGIMLYRLLFAFITGALDVTPVTKVVKILWSRLYTSTLRFLNSFRYTARALSACQRSAIFQTLRTLGQAALVWLAKPRSWLYIQILFGTIALIMQFVSVIQVFEQSSNIIATQMSFGQIVAVGIWVPVLLEYVYLEINGAEDGNKYRLKAPLVVGKGPVPVASGAMQGNASIGGTAPDVSTVPNPNMVGSP